MIWLIVLICYLIGGVAAVITLCCASSDVTNEDSWFGILLFAFLISWIVVFFMIAASIKESRQINRELKFGEVKDE